jgi:hypothetical protein
MDKRIEIINASDPKLLKQQLEQMVNDGWKIKGVIGYNPHDDTSEPFVILEQDLSDDSEINEGLYINQEQIKDQYFANPNKPKKEVSISIG